MTPNSFQSPNYVLNNNQLARAPQLLHIQYCCLVTEYCMLLYTRATQGQCMLRLQLVFQLNKFEIVTDSIPQSSVYTPPRQVLSRMSNESCMVYSLRPLTESRCIMHTYTVDQVQFITRDIAVYPTKRDTYMVTLIIISLQNIGNIKQYIMCLPEHTRALIIFCFSSRFTIHTTRMKIIYDPCQDEKSIFNIIRVLSSITNKIYTTGTYMHPVLSACMNTVI